MSNSARMEVWTTPTVFLWKEAWLGIGELYDVIERGTYDPPNDLSIRNVHTVVYRHIKEVLG